LPPITSLNDFGWNLHCAAEGAITLEPAERLARVTWQGRGAWRVHDGDSEVLARPRRQTLPVVPVTGDWVVVRDEHGSTYVDRVLSRRTVLARGEAGGRSEQQVIAANVDRVAVCASADDVNPRRLERELTAVWSSGATPVVVLTKSDLVPDAHAVARELAAVCLGVDVVPVSVLRDEGLPDVARLVGHGETVALIGPSGVGKSSLVNALVGHEALATTATRADGKGRHTTTSRHLVPMPAGGLLLDTPGMREFAPWADEDALAGTFADIQALARDCRFADCQHAHEPGCAVLAAAESDAVVAQRLTNWRALQRELAWLERRQDARLMREERRRWAAITKSMRGSPQTRS
jgi:ribosome biogenesis GTPase